MVLLLPPEMLHAQPCRIDHSNLIYFYNTKIRFLKSSRMGSIWKASTLTNTSNGKYIVDSSVEDFECLFESCPLGVPVCYIDFGRPNALISVFIEACRQVLETCWIAVCNEHFNAIVLSACVTLVVWRAGFD